MSQAPTKTSPKVRKLYIWEHTPSGDVRFRYEVGPDMFLIRKVPDMPESGSPQATPALRGDAPEALRRQVAELERRGVGYEMNGNQVRITSIPPAEHALMQFFIPDADCFFPGCEGIKEEYMEALSKLEADPSCQQPDKAACAKATLMRKFRSRIEPLVQAVADKLPSPGDSPG